MKKFTRVLALMLVAAMLCIALVACGSKPNEDPAEAKKSLEDAGYNVFFKEFGSVSSNPDETVAVLEEKGYSVEQEENNGDTTITATNTDSFETVTVTYYQKKADADAAYEELEAEMAELGELAALLGYSFGRSDNIVWSGTSEAIAAMDTTPYKGLTAILTATKFDPELDGMNDLKDMDGKTVKADCIKIYYFESEEAAERAFGKLESELNEWIEEMGDSLDHMIETAEEEFGCSVEFDFAPAEATLNGCMVYAGTSGALKDAK